MDGDGSFAAVLRSARHAAGLTLEELADASGVSVRALSDMERGRALGPQRRTVASIAEALKLETTRLDELVLLAKAGRTRSAYLAAAPGLCELPGSIGDFTGRASELGWIFRVVDAVDEAAGRSGTAVISGGPGVGKTTLAVRAAHRVRDRFPGGVHFVDALGMSGHPVDAGEILARVLRALGMRDQAMPQDLAERGGRYRQLLRERRVLVVVDDVASESQVRPLVPGSGDSFLMVTSRRMLAGLEGVQRLHLDPMPAADAYDLLDRILAERAEVPADDGLRRLADLLGGLPLALRIAGNRLVSRPQWSVADLMDRLSATERRLDQLSAGDLKMAAAFAMSYEQLPDPTRLLFRRAALAPGADFSADLAGVVGEIPATVAEDQLDDLVDLGLMETAQGRRYRFHDLVRLYARQRLEHDDEPNAVTASRRRMISWLLTALAAASRVFDSGTTGTDGSGFASHDAALAWIRIEADNWLPALRDAAAHGEHRAVADAVHNLGWVPGRWSNWHGWIDVFTIGLDSAVALGDMTRQAECLIRIGWFYRVSGSQAQPGLEHAERALAAARLAGDVDLEGDAWQMIGRARVVLEDFHGAMDAARVACERYEQIGSVDSLCQALLGWGDIALKLNDVPAALAIFRRAQVLVEDPDSGMTAWIAQASRPSVIGQLGRTLACSGSTSEGIALVQQAAEVAEQVGRRQQQALWFRYLGRDLYDDDRVDEAREYLLRAAEIYDSLGHHDVAGQCRREAAAKGSATGSS